MKLIARLLLFMIVVIMLTVLVLPRVWQPGMTQYAARALPATSSADHGVTLSWHGVSAVLLRDGEHALFIDPFFTRPQGLASLVLNREIRPDRAAIEAGLRAAGVERLDAVLVSHSHYDHAMDAGLTAHLTGADLVGSPSTLNIGRGAGLAEKRLIQAAPDRTQVYGPFTIHWIASRHAGATGGRPTGDITTPLAPPARYMDYRQGGTWSILIEHADGRILHHGSAGYVDGALLPHSADVALLGVALVKDYPAYFDAVVEAVDARVVIPLHWDDFTRPLSAPLRPFPLIVRLDRFFNTADGRAGLRAATLPVGREAAVPW